ncbi:MAG: J domain-containing protein [Microthrixaceae bacterium]
MILAEIQAYLSRPIAPTRRIAMGSMNLPCDPAPGFGGVLIGAIGATFAPMIDDEMREDLNHLLDDLERGARISQPRLRHRFQTDHIGLQRCSYKLIGDGEKLTFRFDSEKGTPAQHVLCAAYATSTLPRECVPTIMATLRKGLSWVDGSDADLIRHLAGRTGHMVASSVGDPVGWAMSTLAMDDASVAGPTRNDIQRAFRVQLRLAHPDHGAEDNGAAARIAELSEARRILLSG